MGLLQRQIFKSVLLACATAVGLFAFVLMVGNVVKDLLGYLVAGQLEPGLFVELLLLIPPFVLSYALPVGMLTGVLLVLGRMSSEHEVTAIRAAGLSLPWVARPILILAALGVLVGLVINFQVMPVAKITYERELAGAVRTNPLSFIVPRTFIREFPGRVLYVGDKQGQTVKDFWLWELDGQGGVRNFIHAESGRVAYDEATDELTLNLVNVRVETTGAKPAADDLAAPVAYGQFGRFPLRLSLRRLFGPIVVHRKLQWYTFPELMAEWRRLAPPGPGASAAERAALAEQRMRVQMAIQDKFNTAFAVFTFALMGVPLGIKVSRHETSANLGVALGMAMTYYFMTVVIGWLEDRPALRPDLLMWLPNLVFLAAGLWLFWRIDRATRG
jgi:lipopolysaccharide export system permease protein